MRIKLIFIKFLYHQETSPWSILLETLPLGFLWVSSLGYLLSPFSCPYQNQHQSYQKYLCSYPLQTLPFQGHPNSNCSHYGESIRLKVLCSVLSIHLTLHLTYKKDLGNFPKHLQLATRRGQIQTQSPLTPKPVNIQLGQAPSVQSSSQPPLDTLRPSTGVSPTHCTYQTLHCNMIICLPVFPSYNSRHFSF